MSTADRVAIAVGIITGAGALLGMASKLWAYAQRMAVLEERVNVLWEFQLRRGHLELQRRGLTKPEEAES